MRAESAQSLTVALGGKWYRHYGLACCPAHPDQNPSLTLADGLDGRLLLHCKAGCSFLEVLQALGLRGLHTSHRTPHLDPAEVARKRAVAEARSRQVACKALAIWNEALPIAGTIAETYLRGRGITCALPDSLRFHPDCWHPTASRLPAMVARIDGLPRLAIHRTYLRDDGTGKSGTAPEKAMLGTTTGGAIRLSCATGLLVVAEGIETALSLSCGLLSTPATIWATLSCAGMAQLRLPPHPGQLIIVSDGDHPGREAANRLAERACALGWSVSMLPAPEGQDWNDILLQKGGRS